MEQVQIADQTGELLGKTRVSRQFWPRVLPNANHAEPRPHHASGGGGGDSTKVAPAAASDSSSSEVRAGHRHKQLRIAVIHPHLRIGGAERLIVDVAWQLSSSLPIDIILMCSHLTMTKLGAFRLCLARFSMNQTF